MPSFYEIGGAMLPPEAISIRQASLKDEPVSMTKKELVSEISRLRGEIGEVTSKSEEKRHMEMREDQLLEVHSSLLAKRPTKTNITIKNAL